MKFFSFKKEEVPSDIRVLGYKLTGPLLLNHPPTLGAHLVNKSYITSLINNGISAAVISDGTIPNSSIPAFSGDLENTAGSVVFRLKEIGQYEDTLYSKVLVNSKGVVVNVSSFSESDLPEISWTDLETSEYKTLEDYGITDAYLDNNEHITQPISVTVTPNQENHLVTKKYIDQLKLNISDDERIGTIVRRPVEIQPYSLMRCDGRVLKKADYPELYNVIGDSNNTGFLEGYGKPWKFQYNYNLEKIPDFIRWTTGRSLPVAMYEPSVFVTSDRVYTVGGNTSGTTSLVYTSAIDEDGNLTNWEEAGSTPEGLYASEVIVNKNRVYVIGGLFNNINSDKVYSATITQEGTIGEWEEFSRLPGPVHMGKSFITKDKLYVLGGIGNPPVYCSDLDREGNIVKWETLQPLPEPMYRTQLAITKNKLYVLGGTNTRSVYSVRFTPTGQLFEWVKENDLPVDLWWSSSVVVKDGIILFGGRGQDTSAVVLYNKLTETGNLTIWEELNNLPNPLQGSDVVILRDKLYLFGGWNGTGRTNVVLSGEFGGGSNDYSPYYNGSIVSVDTEVGADSFRIPDYVNKETPFLKFFIKYKK